MVEPRRRRAGHADRAHRIGQARAVTSYKLIAAGTVEEKVLALQAEKRALLADVFDASDAVSAQPVAGGVDGPGEVVLGSVPALGLRKWPLRKRLKFESGQM